MSSPDSAIKNYSYDFILGDNEPQEINVNLPVSPGSALRQGITYYSVLHKIASDPTSAIITAIQQDEETIRIDYNFKDSMKIALGNGISGRWRGYFSTRVDSGSLWLDAKSLVPLKSISGQVEENYANYII